MDSAVVYKIAKWDELFEKHDTRRCVTMHWLSLPIDFHSAGYAALLDHFERDAAQMYGCWCALLCLASKCPVRGVLSDTKGRARTLSWMQRTSGFPADLFETLLQWAASPSVQWLVSVPSEELTVMLHRASSAMSPDRSATNSKPVRNSNTVPSGTNPEESAIPPEDSAILPDKSSFSPDSFRTTEQDSTEQNKTKQNITQISTSIQGSKDGSMEEILKRSFERGRSDERFCDEVRALANKFVLMKKKARIPNDQLPLELIWQVAWVCCTMDLTVAHGCIERIRTNQVQKPVPYMLGAVRKLCQNHASLDWDRVRKLVPDPPPAKIISYEEQPVGASA